jgi:hypothetical protein
MPPDAVAAAVAQVTQPGEQRRTGVVELVPRDVEQMHQQLRAGQACGPGRTRIDRSRVGPVLLQVLTQQRPDGVLERRSAGRLTPGGPVHRGRQHPRTVEHLRQRPAVEHAVREPERAPVPAVQVFEDGGRAGRVRQQDVQRAFPQPRLGVGHDRRHDRRQVQARRVDVRRPHGDLDDLGHAVGVGNRLSHLLVGQDRVDVPVDAGAAALGASAHAPTVEFGPQVLNEHVVRRRPLVPDPDAVATRGVARAGPHDHESRPRAGEQAL